MTTTKYTVISPASGEPVYRGLTAVQAAQEKLGWDSHLYELQRDPALDVGDSKYWQLLVSQGSTAGMGGAGRMVPAWTADKHIYAWADDEAAAWEQIAAQVIAADWRRGPDVMTDADYDAMLAGAE